MTEINGVQAEPGGLVKLVFGGDGFRVVRERDDDPGTGFWQTAKKTVAAVAGALMLLSFVGSIFLNHKFHPPHSLVRTNTIVFFSSLGVLVLMGVWPWLAHRFGPQQPAATDHRTVQGVASVQYEQIDPQGGVRVTLRWPDQAGTALRYTVPGPRGAELYRAFDELLRDTGAQVIR